LVQTPPEEGVADLGRREAGAQGMVLGRGRGAEDGDDVVALRRDDRAAVFAHAGQHRLDSAIEIGARVVGLEVEDRAGGLDQIGDEDGDVAQFAGVGAAGVRGCAPDLRPSAVDHRRMLPAHGPSSRIARPAGRRSARAGTDLTLWRQDNIDCGH
jgi:hypothetical protein